MMSNNKFVNHYSKPYYWGAVFYTGLSILMGVIMYNYSDTPRQKVVFSDGSIGYDNTMDALAVMFIIICLFMAYYSASIIPNSANKKVNNIALKYLKEKIRQNPDLKSYEYLLNNQKAMQIIVNALSEEFGEAEIKRIVEIAKNTDKNNSKSDFEEKEIFAKIEQEILNLVKEHELKDPEFINKILLQLSRASYAYPVTFQAQNQGR